LVHLCIEFCSSSCIFSLEGQLRLPKSLGMEQFGITCAGNPEDLGKLSADVEELDLADNLLSSWDEVCCQYSYAATFSFETLLCNGF